MYPMPMTHIATRTGRLAVLTSASSHTVFVFCVAWPAWRSSTCATWFSSTVTSAIAIREAIHGSMPRVLPRNSLSRFMPPL